MGLNIFFKLLLTVFEYYEGVNLLECYRKQLKLVLKMVFLFGKFVFRCSAIFSQDIIIF